jgi:protease PrsW
MGLVLSLFFGYIPAFINAGIIYSVDRYEKEPKRLLVGVFIWGAVVAAGAAFVINSLLGAGIYLFTESNSTADFATGSVIAPLIEETLKGAAVLIVFWRARREFDSVLDGIVYAAITALGFAGTENLYYIYHYGYTSDGLSGLLFMAFVRVILVGWQHPFYTAFIGIGLATARLNRSRGIKILAVILGWAAAILTHSIHNTLSYFTQGTSGLYLTTLFDWTGWLALLCFILWMINRERHLVIRYLGEEMRLGTLTAQQYFTACSPSAQMRARLAAVRRRSYRATTRFYQLCGEITHKKNQLARVGDENGNQAIIDQLRGELRQLSGLLQN